MLSQVEASVARRRSSRILQKKVVLKSNSLVLIESFLLYWFDLVTPYNVVPLKCSSDVFIGDFFLT